MSNLDNSPSESVIVRYWQRIPMVIRAVVTGNFVFAIVGIVAWMAVLAFIPIPWSLVVMWLVLWLYLKYFSGRWWLKSTAQARADNFRAKKLSSKTWKWSLFAALIIVVIIESALVLTFRMVEFPVAETGMDAHFTVWVLILVISGILFVWATRKILAARRSE